MDDTDLDQTIQRIADKSFAKCMADYEAEREAQRRKAEPTAEQKQAQSLNAFQFREHITEHALLHGVNPKGVRFVMREAEAVFEWRAGALVPRHDATDPSDPVAPLTPARWLAGLRKTDEYLFAAPGQAH
ncbi:MAG: hypothetical protein ABI665_00155 [Vicinamibacterales bacterium]